MKTLTKKYLFILIILFTFSHSTFAGGPDYGFSVHPGIKFGHAIGDNGGFMFGFSLAIISEQKSQPSFGWTINFDVIPQGAKITAGAGMYWLGGEMVDPGLSGGPTVLFNKNGSTYFGFSIAAFAGSMAYPYFNYTAVINHESIFEFGLKLVYPDYSGETLDERRSSGFSSGPDIAYGP